MPDTHPPTLDYRPPQRRQKSRLFGTSGHFATGAFTGGVLFVLADSLVSDAGFDQADACSLFGVTIIAMASALLFAIAATARRHLSQLQLSERSRLLSFLTGLAAIGLPGMVATGLHRFFPAALDYGSWFFGGVFVITMSGPWVAFRAE